MPSFFNLPRMADWSALLDPMVQYFREQYEFYYDAYQQIQRIYQDMRREIRRLQRRIGDLQHENEYFAQREERLFEIVRSIIAHSTRENIEDYMDLLNPVARTLFSNEILEGYDSEETVIDLTFMEYQ